jgi:hypothetical protein
MKGLYLVGQEKQDFLDFVSRTVDENKGLIESTARMEVKLQKVEAWGKTLKVKCDSEVQKEHHVALLSNNLYHTEAVYTTERLHKEIEALKREKGEEHFVQPAPPLNPEVDECKTIRWAMACGLEDVPEHLIPGTAYDPNLRTLISPTQDALISLRLNG